jgi:hypothetical protein
VDDFTKSEPDWLELESSKPLSMASKITSLSEDTLKRRYAEYVTQLSERRRGMKLKHILAITNGTI